MDDNTLISLEKPRNGLNGADPSSEGTPHGVNNDEYPSSITLALIMAAVLLSVFMAALDIGIVATAIPAITTEFHSLDQVGWYGSAYFATIGPFSPFWTKLYKFYSIKWVFIADASVFLLGSVIAGASPNSATLIAGRAIQGVGAAGLIGGGFLIVPMVFPPHKRPAATGVVGAIFIFSAVLGPLIGGAFTSNVSWRWCFYVNLPIGGLAIMLLVFFFRIPAPPTLRPATIREVILSCDLPGIVLSVASLVCFVLALEWAGVTKPWTDGSVIAVLVLSFMLIIAFAVVEYLQGDRALLPPRLLSKRVNWTNALFVCFLNGGDWIPVYYLPIYFQALHGLSAQDSGVHLMPMIACVSVACAITGALLGKTRHYVLFLICGGLITLVASVLLYTLEVDTPPGRYMGYEVLLGFGLGFCIQVPVTVVQAFAAPEDIAESTGVVMFFQLVSGVLEIGAAQSIFTNRLIQSIPSFAPGVDPQVVIATGASEVHSVFAPDILPGIEAAYMVGLRGAFTFALACVVVCVLLGFIAPVRRLEGLKGETKAAVESTVES